ncbi:MAG: zinc-binding dehydrogenase [Chloroflexi bacterium]|nr:zinc-binding dehydrogenase [Chloroflexota bacterium]
MKAWQFTNTHEPLVLAEVEEPTPGPGEVLIDIKAAGLCHSDVGLLEDEGWLQTLAKRPITIGHEVAGVITGLGSGVTGWKIGDRVGICPTTEAGAPGYVRDGGFSYKTVTPAVSLVHIPDNVSFIQGAAGTDAGMTSHHAVIANGAVTAGTTVGIIGFGGLGQIGSRVAVLAGANVYVAEVNEQVWQNALDAGVKGVKKSIKEFEGVTFDVIIDFAGFGVTTAEAIDVVGVGGRVVQVGMGRLEATISTASLILRKVTLIGSQGGTKADVEGVYRYFATGKLTPHVTEITFDQIPEGIAQLKRGEVIGRLVAKISE